MDNLLACCYAYYSGDGVNFFPLTLPPYANDVYSWPIGSALEINGRAIMLSNIPDALVHPDQGTGMAFYSNFITKMGVSHRQGGSGELAALGIYGFGDDYSQTISDYNNWHTLRRVMVVGNVNTIKTGISICKQRIKDWGNWLLP